MFSSEHCNRNWWKFIRRLGTVLPEAIVAFSLGSGCTQSPAVNPPDVLPEATRNKTCHPLPSPLQRFGVDNAFDWYNVARPQILQMLASKQYGDIPPRPEEMRIELIREQRGMFDGTACRREYRITMGNKGRNKECLATVYLPEKSDNPLAAVTALRFTKSRYPVKQLMEANVALAVAFYGDFYLDNLTPEAREQSIFQLFGEVDGHDRHLTAISAWAFGYRMLCDLLRTLPETAECGIWAQGHSRLGKTALWAVANDPRFAGVVSNQSGCGGAALYRDKNGETLKKIVERFPYWFVPELDQYRDREAELPWDQHWLLAVIAPRPVLVTSASEDLWADPQNEFRAAREAGEIYRLFGVPAIAPAQPFPPVDSPLLQRGIGYYVRSGKHQVADSDWMRLVEFILLNTLRK